MSELKNKAKTLVQVAQTCNALKAVCKNCIAECEFEDNKVTFKGKWVLIDNAEAEIKKVIDEYNKLAKEATENYYKLDENLEDLNRKVEQFRKWIETYMGDDISINAWEKFVEVFGNGNP